MMMKKLIVNHKGSNVSCFLTSSENFGSYQFLSNLEKVALVDSGVTKASLLEFRKLSGLLYDELAEFLMVTDRTIHTKKMTDCLNPSMSNRFIALLDLYSLGDAVFGGIPEFREWLCTPNYLLKRKAPKELLRTYPGTRYIMELLNGILMGQPA